MVLEMQKQLHVYKKRMKYQDALALAIQKGTG